MRKHTRGTSESKRLVVTQNDSVFVGLDVHKKSVYAALRLNGQEMNPALRRRCRAKPT